MLLQLWPPEQCFVSKLCILLSKCSNTVSSWCKFSIFLTSSLRGSSSVRFSQLLLQIILLISSKYILCQKKYDRHWSKVPFTLPLDTRWYWEFCFTDNTNSQERAVTLYPHDRNMRWLSRDFYVVRNTVTLVLKTTTILPGAFFFSIAK